MNASPLLSGLLYSILYMLVGTLLASLLMLGTSIPESSWVTLTFCIHGMAMLAGGFISGKRSGQKGWYYGGTLGLLYSVTVWIVGFLAYDAGFSLQTLYLLLLALGVGAIGGIVGVNMKK